MRETEALLRLRLQLLLDLVDWAAWVVLLMVGEPVAVLVQAVVVLLVRIRSMKGEMA